MECYWHLTTTHSFFVLHISPIDGRAHFLFKMGVIFSQYPSNFLPLPLVKSNPGNLTSGGLSSPLTTVFTPTMPTSPPALLTLPDSPSVRSDCAQYSSQLLWQYCGSWMVRDVQIGVG